MATGKIDKNQKEEKASNLSKKTKQKQLICNIIKS